MIKLLIPRGRESFKAASDVFLDLYEQITSERPETVFEDDGASDTVCLGSDAENVLAHRLVIEKKMPDFSIRYGSDDYQLLSVEDNSRTVLFLAGGNVRSTFYAVYDFFERVAGCRYFWDGDIIPKSESISIKGLDVVESPRFEYRGLRYFAHRSLMRFQAEHWDFEDWKKEFDWVMKKRLNLAMLRIGIDDLFQKAFPEDVPYPAYDKRLPEAKDRSFDDRTLFWPLEYRAEIRRRVLAYGRSLGLFQPEDCGTMTHWYSRTPYAFLEKYKPSFVPQSNNNYNEETGLVWDIRSDENMERYLKLTEAHVKYYGDGSMFHTIGLAERRCYNDRAANHAMKLYAYRRINSALRARYPHAPLLIASWDFISTWTHDEVKALVSELDPANTIILDYTSDIYSDLNNFRNWGLVGRFPWIFGIFHAFEASNEIRGMYDKIADRFPVAVQDPMCKGVVFWPENSHQDTLMLEYFPAIAWNPELYHIEEFIPCFCRRRYPLERVEAMERIWLDALPLIKLCTWGAYAPDGPQREVYPDPYFLISKKFGTWYYGEIDPKRLEYFWNVCESSLPHIEAAQSILERLSAFDFETLEAFTKRDIIDIARTIFSRVMNYAMAKGGLIVDSWRNNSKQWLYDGKTFGGQDVVDHFENMKAFGVCLSDLLEASKEFSLFFSLEELKKRHTTNPDFEHTLKGNAENNYCRSFIYELARYCYEPGFEIYVKFAKQRVAADDRSSWTGLTDMFEDSTHPVIDAFYAKPLAEMAPDTENAFKRLPETLRKMAGLVRLMYT